METIVLRTFFLYIIILLTFRLMGKREIGQLSVIDFVISIMIAELAVICIEDPKKTMLTTIVPIAILLFIQISLAYISLKSDRWRHILDGKPSTIISHGEIDDKEMKKQRYNLDDLLVQLRQKNIESLSDVEFAILEPNGALSVYKKTKAEQGEYPDIVMPLPLIMDGKIQKKNVEDIGQTQLWLRQQMRKLGFKNIKDITFCSIDKNGTFYVDAKN